MSHPFFPAPSRRTFLAGSAAAAASVLIPLRGPAHAEPRLREVSLRPAPGRMRLVPEPCAETDAWSYDGRVPGPEIRVRQGDRLRVRVRNGLQEATTVHWHGVRLPNSMDGVPHLMQPPIRPCALPLRAVAADRLGQCVPPRPRLTRARRRPRPEARSTC